jgi:predicted metal-dependent hydrolase
MTAGRAAFNRGDHFLAHELWEEVWRSSSGPERRWLQGLIQLAAGLHQLARGRTAPAATLLLRALAKLEDAPDRIDGLAVSAARRAALRVSDLLRRGAPADPAAVVL